MVCGRPVACRAPFHFPASAPAPAAWRYSLRSAAPCPWRASLAVRVNQFLTFRTSLRQNVIWVRSLPRIYLPSLTSARAPPRALDYNTHCVMLARVISFEILFLAAGCVLLVGIAHWF